MQNKKVKRGVTLVFKGDNSNKNLDIHLVDYLNMEEWEIV